MNTQTVSLDVTKKPSVLPVIRLRQGDKNGTTINAEIYDNGEPLSLSGKAVKFAMQSPDGTAYYDVEGTASGNVATFDIDETYACAITGITDRAYVNVLEGSNVICSTNRVMVVIFESAEDGADPEQSYSSGITEATNRANAAAEAAEGVVLQAVPLMSETVRGGAQLGDGLSIVDGKLTAEAYGLPTMSASTKGGAKLGSGLAVDDDALSVDASTIDEGTLGVSHGGTGADTAAGARTSLDVYSTGEVDAALSGKADQADVDTALGEKVSKSGDTVTGILSVKATNIDRDGENPSSDTPGNYYYRLLDKDDEYIGSVYPYRMTDGEQRTVLQAVNEKADGTQVTNYLHVAVDKNGERSFHVPDKGAFRSAIDALASSPTTNSGSNLNNQAIGEVWWGNNLTNAPDGSTGFFLAFRIASLQVAYRHMSSGDTIEVWARNFMNSTWGTWTRLDNRLVSTTTASSIITAASGITIDSASYMERGGVATLRVTFKRTGATSTGSFTVGTIASGKRTAVNIYGTASHAALTYAAMVTNGTLTCYANAATSTSTVYGLSLTYVLA